MKAGNKVTAYKYNKNDELLRTDTLNDRKGRPYIDIDVTLGDNRLNENVVNHYNALNQLTQTLTKNYKVSFTYDAGGLRTSKTVNGETTIFVWDGDQLVMELTKSGKVKKRYIRGNDLIFADKGTENASGEASGKQYYVTDPYGNVVQLTDESGRVTKTTSTIPLATKSSWTAKMTTHSATAGSTTIRRQKKSTCGRGITSRQ